MPEARCEVLCLNLEVAERIRAQLPGDLELATAALRAKALGDGSRVSVAAALYGASELCGCDIAWIVGRSQKLVSHHLKVLRAAELVDSRRDGKVVFYALTPVGRELFGSVLAVSSDV